MTTAPTKEEQAAGQGRLRERANRTPGYCRRCGLAGIHVTHDTVTERLDVGIMGQPNAAGLTWDQAHEIGVRVATLQSSAMLDFAESVVRQFGYWADTVGGVSAGGLSTLEEAFGILGWDDPHPLPDSRCVWPDGCMKRGESGTPVAADHPVYGGMRYVWTCFDHSPEGLRRAALRSTKPG